MEGFILLVYIISPSKRPDEQYAVYVKVSEQNGELVKYYTVLSKKKNMCYVIDFENIKDKDLASEIDKKINEYLNAKHYDKIMKLLDQIKNIHLLNISSLFADLYTLRGVKTININNKEYQENCIYFDYEKLMESLNIPKLIEVTPIIMKYKLKVAIANKFNNLLPASAFGFCIISEVYNIKDIIIFSHYRDCDKKIIAKINDVNDINLEKIYSGKLDIYLQPINEKVTDYFGTTLLNSGYEYYYYLSNQSQVKKDEVDKSKKYIMFVDKKDRKYSIKKILKICKHKIKKKYKNCYVDFEVCYENNKCIAVITFLK